MKARCILFTWLVSSPLLAQPGALNLASLIDLPVAKTYPTGNVATELRLYSGGGLLSSVAVGLTDNFSIGISYGGSNLIGTGRPEMNPQPCVQARVLLFEEQMLSPGVLLGFDSQGLGGYQKSIKRYLIRSKGIYAVASKNTSFLGGLGIHAGVNWSLENTDTANPRLNVFIGCPSGRGSTWLRYQRRQRLIARPSSPIQDKIVIRGERIISPDARHRWVISCPAVTFIDPFCSLKRTNHCPGHPMASDNPQSWKTKR